MMPGSYVFESQRCDAMTSSAMEPIVRGKYLIRYVGSWATYGGTGPEPPLGRDTLGQFYLLSIMYYCVRYKSSIHPADVIGDTGPGWPDKQHL